MARAQLGGVSIQYIHMEPIDEEGWRLLVELRTNQPMSSKERGKWPFTVNGAMIGASRANRHTGQRRRSWSLERID